MSGHHIFTNDKINSSIEKPYSGEKLVHHSKLEDSKIFEDACKYENQKKKSITPRAGGIDGPKKFAFNSTNGSTPMFKKGDALH